MENNGDYTILGALNNNSDSDTPEKNEESNLTDVETDELIAELQRRWLWENSFTKIN